MDNLENQYQACLDEGVHMLICTQVYYKQMDSMLNVVYKQLRSKLDATAQQNLKKEQVHWLEKRNHYFKTVKLAPEEQELGGEDAAMILLDKKAAYVKDRVLVLIGKLEQH